MESGLANYYANGEGQNSNGYYAGTIMNPKTNRKPNKKREKCKKLHKARKKL